MEGIIKNIILLVGMRIAEFVICMCSRMNCMEIVLISEVSTNTKQVMVILIILIAICQILLLTKNRFLIEWQGM